MYSTQFSTITAWKVSKYGVISGSNTGKHGLEITQYLDPYHAAYAGGNEITWILWAPVTINVTEQ